MSKVIVIEDDATMAQMVAYNLERQGLEVLVEPDGSRGLTAAKAPDAALVILDVMLPGMDGMAVAESLRAVRADVPILMLTALGEEKSKLRGFSAGVDDYLTKPFSMDELVARVKVLLRRSKRHAIATESPKEIHLGDLKLHSEDMRCWVNEEEIELRPKEFQLLATLASEPGRLFSRVALAEKVWGYAHLGDTRTIDTHVKNLRKKVEGHSAFNYIETVRGVGYRFRVRPKSQT